MLAKNEILQQRYRIIRQLGQGGMGAVYEARDERLGSSVALKEIIIELDKIPTQKQRELFRRAFEREARLLANLHHEVFPRVMDYFSEENRQFLIMELVFGDDLGELLGKNQRPFALKEALQWANHLLDALDYLHTQEPPIYHRDIKPQNLKATARGKIKLLDFGIAKSVDQTASAATNQTFVGATLDYAPIEQILPAITPTFREFIVLKHGAKANAVLKQNTDSRCDLYAVGATFYHLLTNRAPVDSAKRSLDYWEGDKDPLPNPSELNSDIPPSISAWLLKALEIERENRFASALEMQIALQTAINEAKAEFTTSEKTIFLPETQISSAENETQKFDGQRLTQAKTEILVDQQTLLIEAEQATSLASQPPQTQFSGAGQTLISETPSSTTQSSQTVPFVTQSSLPKQAVTQSLRGTSFSTNPAGSISRPEHLESAPLMFLEPKANPKFGFNISLLLPILAIGLLSVGGIAGFFWLNNSNSTDTKNSGSNATISTPTATSAATLTPAPKSGDPTVAPTKNISPRTNPVIESTVPKIPVPKPTTKTPKTISDDCRYNGRCN